MINGIRKTRDIDSQTAFNSVITEEITPGSGIKSDQEIESRLRGNVSTEYHPFSSCRMGIDADSVVNEVGQVDETEGLRIVDASIIISNVTENLILPVLMMAEKIPDPIKVD